VRHNYPSSVVVTLSDTPLSLNAGAPGASSIVFRNSLRHFHRRLSAGPGLGGLAEMDGAVPPKPVFEESSWRKASYSYGNGECIEVAASAGEHIGVRDSTAPSKGSLAFSIAEWQSFLASIEQ
jgi:hypothetical protein